MSRSILALVTGYPLAAPAETNEARPQRILSLVAINETTGKIFDCTEDPETTDPACHPLTGAGQGLTLVHFSAQRERFLWDMGCM